MAYDSDSDGSVDADLMALLMASRAPPPPPPPDTKVLKSAHHIFDNSIDVALNRDATYAAAEKIYTAMKTRNYSTQTWASHDLHPGVGKVGFETEEDVVAAVFLIDLLNFSFWSLRGEEERFGVQYVGKKQTGYWSLCAAVRRALDEGIPITSPYLWVDEQAFTLEMARYVFRSETEEEMPLLEARVECMREAGRVLCEEYDGHFVNMIKEAGQSAVNLVLLVVEKFSCFRDEQRFEGKRVTFYKRAQILVADLWACFNATSYGTFPDITALTMFADYRIPQILQSLGCLWYSPGLETAIMRKQLIPSGSAWEIQIRGCSIWCVELIRRRIIEMHPEVGEGMNAVLLDFYLYDAAKEMEARGGGGLPHHRTRSIWY
ncbi:hypothetical protein BJ508DRAFT_377916 [Ascobolus immersus RN42]|uniref:Queuosine 5'-phosphate N-glycosylase/hydrolase n=1 Tax=Ascobolus immersus RN42 TaxID=1160509 RepID=A0A3N4I0Z5_ASCIM|nr:hypothetical protein BJ508DRAFT_377916 [Ascobolus immersus RN42]